jgi:hypothetical protein
MMVKIGEIIPQCFFHDILYFDLGTFVICPNAGRCVGNTLVILGKIIDWS